MNAAILSFLSVFLVATGNEASIVDEGAVLAHIDFSHADRVIYGGQERVDFVWRIGDRSYPMSGVRLSGKGGELAFSLPPVSGNLLTLELREFRTAPGQSPAYVVEVDGTPVAFRCRKYDGDGPASTFIDLPERDDPAPLRVRAVNRAPWPLHLSEAYLYRDIEQFVRDRGMAIPMRLGCTVPWSHISAEHLRAVKDRLPTGPDLLPMYTIPTVPHAFWSAEDLRNRLEVFLDASAKAQLPVELQFITWWAGTPMGMDGRGGRWLDPEYQQVTYDPATGDYGLTVPNRWSNVPWLTMRHPRFNAFKSKRFNIAGRVLREVWDKWHATRSDPFPVFSIVLDNEPTYWAAGMPNSSMTLQADFNPAMVAAAKEEGLTLDPADGLSEAERLFLQRTILAYNRVMASGFQEGLGNCALRDSVFSHTYQKGFGFDNPSEAFSVGVLTNVRFGGEWFFKTAEEIRHMDLVRELGVPAGINVEVGSLTAAAREVPFAYATGCSRLSLFNASEELLRNTKTQVNRGWPDYPPVPWRPLVKTFRFGENDGWEAWFSNDEVYSAAVEGLPMRLLQGREVEANNRSLLRLNARELTGEERFERLAIEGLARAFVFPNEDEASYMAIRAGHSPDALHEAARLVNMQGRFQVDVSTWVEGAETAYIEFDMHPRGLSGWVGLMELSVAISWAEEVLLACNRSYGAERLRAESLLVGWRSDAARALRLCSETPGVGPEETEAVQALVADMRYCKAVEAAHGLIHAHQADTHMPVPNPPANRVERGMLMFLPEKYIQVLSYDSGVLDAAIPKTEDTEVVVTINGKVVPDAAPLPGDDARINIRDSVATRIDVARGEVTGRVTAAGALTPFALPTLTLEGHSTMYLDGRATVTDRNGERLEGVFPYKVGQAIFTPGDWVRVRWNPATGKIVEAAPAGS